MADGKAGVEQKRCRMPDAQGVDVLIEGCSVLREPDAEIGAVGAYRCRKVGKGELRITEDQLFFAVLAEQRCYIVAVVLHRNLVGPLHLRRPGNNHQVLRSVNEHAYCHDVRNDVGNVPEQGSAYDAQHKDDRRKPHHGPLHPQAMQHIFVDVAVIDLQIKGKAPVHYYVVHQEPRNFHRGQSRKRQENNFGRKNDIGYAQHQRSRHDKRLQSHEIHLLLKIAHQGPCTHGKRHHSGQHAYYVVGKVMHRVVVYLHVDAWQENEVRHSPCKKQHAEGVVDMGHRPFEHDTRFGTEHQPAKQEHAGHNGHVKNQIYKVCDGHKRGKAATFRKDTAFPQINEVRRIGESVNNLPM